MVRKKSKISCNNNSKNSPASSHVISCNSGIRKWLLEYAVNLHYKVESSDEFFEFIISLIDSGSRSNLVRILNEQYSLISGDRKVKEINDIYKHDEVSHYADCCMEVSRKGRQYAREIESFLYKSLLKQFHKCRRVDLEIRNRFEIFRKRLLFDDVEMRIIRFLYCKQTSNTLKKLCDKYSEGCELIKIVAVANDLPLPAVRKSLQNSSKLLYLETIHSDHSLRHDLDIDDDILLYLSGIGDSNMVEKYYRRDKGPIFPVESFNVPKRSLFIVDSLVNSLNSFNLLLYGKSGTGKSEFARSIAKTTGLPVYIVEQGEDGSVKTRKIALEIAVNLATDNPGIVIFDEADDFINTAHDFFIPLDTIRKSWINFFLDRSKARIIWITNRVDLIEESVRRRFDYSIHFNAFTKKERLLMWQNMLKRHPLKKLIPATLIERLASSHKVDAAGIANVLDKTSSVIASKKKKAIKWDVESIIEDVLSSYKQLISGHTNSEKVFNSTGYDPDILNLDIDLSQLYNVLKTFAHKESRSHGDEKPGMNLLFWGPSGTGKSEFAFYLGKYLNLDVIRRCASDLLSPYVGMTEKYIKGAFREAERSKSILLIDEADTFLSDRKMAVRLWESSMVNELLTCIEDHKGILICTTNIIDCLDLAVMRRFHWKIGFHPLKPEHRPVLFIKYFRDILKNGKLDSASMKWLENIPDLTPGDFHTVKHRLQYSGCEITPQEICKELELETRYRHNPKIGF